MSESRIYLNDLLDRAVVESAGPGFVELQSFVINRQNRFCVFQHPPSRIIWPGLVLGEGGRLRFGCAIKPAVWKTIGSPVIFSVAIRAADGAERLVFEREIDPRSIPEHRNWNDGALDLSDWSGSWCEIIFSTRSVEPDTSFAWAGWADPVLIHEVEKPVPVKSPGKALPDVLLITCDALRLDRLGCYGSQCTRTPALDALAADGLRIVNASSPSDCTFASYASLLTGLLPHKHSVLAEWGRIADSVVSFPEMLARQGYRTTLAVSEQELAHADTGFPDRFQRVIPCLSNPAQRAEVTVRRLLQAMDPAGVASTFTWLQLFEPHPPNLAPAPFDSKHYPHDPTDPERAFRPEWVEKIYAFESCLHFDTAAVELSQNIIPPVMMLRLRDSVRALRGEPIASPDFGSHIRGLGAAAHPGMGFGDLLDWLELQLNEWQPLKPMPELTAWLLTISELLRHPQRDLLAWLDGVVDFRYPIALYNASVEYADQETGRLLDALRARGAYDETLIVFTAPHGECLDEAPMIFHHHLPIDTVLRVPLIIKPPRSFGISPRAVESGEFRHTDLVPTLLDLLGLEVPVLDGVSRAGELRAGILEKQDAVVHSMMGVFSCLQRGPWKLVRLNMPGEHWPLLAEGEMMKPFLLFRDGDEAHDLSEQHPAVVGKLREALERAIPLASLA